MGSWDERKTMKTWKKVWGDFWLGLEELKREKGDLKDRKNDLMW